MKETSPGLTIALGATASLLGVAILVLSWVARGEALVLAGVLPIMIGLIIIAQAVRQRHRSP